MRLLSLKVNLQLSSYILGGNYGRKETKYMGSL